MRWCFLCSTEFPEGTPMVMAKGSNICVPCSETPRGQREVRGHDAHAGYRPNPHGGAMGKWQRIYAAMGKPGYYKRSYEK